MDSPLQYAALFTSIFSKVYNFEFYLLRQEELIMKKIALSTFAAIFAMAFVGCETASNTNVTVNGNKVANNEAVVVNNNSNATNANVNTNAKSDDLTREDFDKDRAKYEAEAKESKSTIGQGANDLWLWTKTRAALAATDELRDSTINVDVSNDVVTLKGTVGTAAQKSAAVKTAQSVEGVKDVKDELKVDAKDSLTNQATSLSDSDGKSNANANKK
jgi:hyperosmotically inducible protein